MGEASRKDGQFLRTCVSSAPEFSTCSKAQYFSIVTNREGYILGTGYNGGPRGMEHCSDGGCPRMLNNTPSGSPYDDCIAIHAEANALLHSNWDQRQGGSLYVNGVPCFTCAKLIANSGVARLVYLEPTEERLDSNRALRFLEQCGLELVCID